MMLKRFPPIFVAIFILLFGWQIFIHFVAPFATIQLLYFYQVDKILHLLGGFVVVGTSLRSLYLGQSLAMGLLVLAAILWEVFEWFVAPDVKELFVRNYVLWRKDTILDLVLGMIGGFAALIAYRDK